MCALPTSRKAAIEVGASHYFTGKACVRGHVDRRHRNGSCLACGREDQAARLADPEHAKKHSAWTLARYHRRKGDPGFLENIRTNARASSALPARKEVKAAYDRRREPTPEQDAVRLAKARARYEQRKDDVEFRQHASAARKKFRGRHPDREAASTRAYQAKKRGAAPPWLSKEHKRQMREFYAEARRLTKLTGVKHVVDHIHPLRGKTLSGLHVPWNLQVLTDKENAVKGNRLPWL